MSSQFNRQLLPPARVVYEQELGKLRRSSRDWWRPKAGCPFHPSKSKTSFSVNLETGGFYCFSCGAKGGDVIAFVRLRYGLSFAEACKRFGCWEDGKRTRARPDPLARYLVMIFVIDGQEYRAEILDEPKNELQLHRRSYAEAAARLLELRNGSAEKFEGEEEAQWSILADTWELIQMEAGVNG